MKFRTVLVDLRNYVMRNTDLLKLARLPAIGSRRRGVERGVMTETASKEAAVETETTVAKRSTGRRFSASRGGHAPGQLRDWLLNYVETGELDEMTDKGLTLRWLIGRLWNCTDILPGWAHHELGLSGRSTYACAVRFLRAAGTDD
jgi:hypothetical protein